MVHNRLSLNICWMNKQGERTVLVRGKLQARVCGKLRGAEGSVADPAVIQFSRRKSEFQGNAASK